MTDYSNVQDVESTAATSVTSGSRTAEQFMQAAKGDSRHAIDSTETTSTSAPRSAEEILQDMKEEDKQKESSAKSSVKSKVSSEFEKWKKAGVNKKDTIDSTTEDSVNSITDSAKNAVTSEIKSSLGISGMTGASTAGITTTGISAVQSLTDSNENNGSSDNFAKVSAPTDEAIAAYQQSVSQAESKGAKVKSLPYTNDQQLQWNAQDQHRMYANYGNMYEHGENETEYNVAMLNSALVSKNIQSKSLPTVPSFKQKFLAAVQQNDSTMNINTLSLDDIMNGKIDLLDVGEQKQGSDDLSYVNNQISIPSDKYASVDHQVDARDEQKQSIANSFVKAAESQSAKFMNKVSDRMAMLNDELHVDQITANGQLSADYDREFF